MDAGTWLALLMAAAVAGLYFLPYWIARSRKHPQYVAIGALNLFLGWTLVGLVVALVWAYTVTPPARAPTPVESKKPPRDDDDDEPDVYVID